jgi:tetratricopeptide (TPR) repeat protein
MISYFRFLIADFRFAGLRPLLLKRPTPFKFHQSAISNQQSKISPHLSIIAILIVGTLTVHSEETPRSAMRKGLKAYKAGDYTNSVHFLKKTALEFPNIGNYNLGNAHYRNGDFEAAEKAFNEALRTTDLELQAKAYFNRGNALLARTTVMTGPEQIGLAAELAFHAVGMYEKAILLDPADMDAKRNYEKARELRLTLEYTKGKWLYDHAEALLQEYKAKEAQKNYQQAKTQFEHILEDVDPTHEESKQLLPKATERLAMLRQALEEAEHDLQMATQLIEDYQYMLAAQRLTTETDNRKYAFDLKPDLKKQYEETIEKNQEVLKIIQELSNLNIVK